ncbi:hypothetical protein FRC02_006292 [Tulasnella sp. 418]|nr:hypothetical protein FRC02_006292 [Tulasnella sp. 418]
MVSPSTANRFSSALCSQCWQPILQEIALPELAFISVLLLHIFDISQRVCLSKGRVQPARLLSLQSLLSSPPSSLLRSLSALVTRTSSPLRVARTLDSLNHHPLLQ